MKHQKELIEKYKKKYLQFYPYPMLILNTCIETDKQTYYMIDFLSYFYYYIFLFFRNKFPIIIYQIDNEIIDMNIKAIATAKEDKKRKRNDKFINPVVIVFTILAAVVNIFFKKFTNQLFTIDIIYAKHLNYSMLFLVGCIIIFNIIIRTKELREALKLDKIKRYKAVILSKRKTPLKIKQFLIAAHLVLIPLSLFIFMLPSNRWNYLISLILSFISVYSWWFLLSIQYFNVDEFKILEELDY